MWENFKKWLGSHPGQAVMALGAGIAVGFCTAAVTAGFGAVGWVIAGVGVIAGLGMTGGITAIGVDAHSSQETVQKISAQNILLNTENQRQLQEIATKNQALALKDIALKKNATLIHAMQNDNKKAEEKKELEREQELEDAFEEESDSPSDSFTI